MANQEIETYWTTVNLIVNCHVDGYILLKLFVLSFWDSDVWYLFVVTSGGGGGACVRAIIFYFCLDCALFKIFFPVNIGWREIDIHGCYSVVKFNFAPVCAYKNNRRTCRHNAQCLTLSWNDSPCFLRATQSLVKIIVANSLTHDQKIVIHTICYHQNYCNKTADEDYLPTSIWRILLDPWVT